MNLIIPNEVTAGTTLAATLCADTGFPSDTWTLTVALIGPDSSQVEATCTALSTYEWKVRISFGTTANMPAGVHRWAAYLADDTERYKIDSGEITVLADVSDASTTYNATDTRGKLERIYDALVDAHVAMASDQITTANVNVEGFSKTFRSLEELGQALERYRRLARQERRKYAKIRTIRYAF